MEEESNQPRGAPSKREKKDSRSEDTIEAAIESFQKDEPQRNQQEVLKRKRQFDYKKTQQTESQPFQKTSIGKEILLKKKNQDSAEEADQPDPLQLQTPSSESSHNESTKKMVKAYNDEESMLRSAQKQYKKQEQQKISYLGQHGKYVKVDRTYIAQYLQENVTAHVYTYNLIHHTYNALPNNIRDKIKDGDQATLNKYQNLYILTYK